MLSVDSKLKSSFTNINPSLIRNVCIIAHVDHGKTTLADYLISSNGIISTRLAGKLRYMDCRDDEQIRGITMKSSAISLYYDPVLINLIDSPGHIDFSSEVNLAINLADVAIIVIDVVEGICSQTETLLRKAVFRQLDIILVINKIDRLSVELKMSCAEAHTHIQRLIERVNSCFSQILQSQYIEDEWQKLEEVENELQFDPIKGNLIFASAFYGYAFTLNDFALLWSKKLNIPKEDLEPYMFSFDRYFHTTSKKVLFGAQNKGKRCLFEQLVLEPLWELHKCAFIDKDLERLKALALKLGLSDCKRKRQIDEAFSEFMGEWLPLTNVIIKTVCKFGRSPIKTFDTQTKSDEFIITDKIRKNKNDGDEIRCTKIFGIYIIIGKELISIPLAPAGQICALEAEDGKWISGHTLISKNYFQGVDFESDKNDKLYKQSKNCCLQFESTHEVEPIVCVTIQPASGASEDFDELKLSLKQLSILDGAVRLFEQENGDLALFTAGEIHLQKCLKDLNDLGQGNITVSEPIVPFLETIVPDLQLSSAKIITQHETECYIKQYNMKIRLRAVPLCNEIVECIQKNFELVDSLCEGNQTNELKDFFNKIIKIAKTYLPKIKGTWWTKKSETEIINLFGRIWSFGPITARSNILINAISDYDGPFVWQNFDFSKKLRPLNRAILGGFALAVSQGPLCDEPMQGVCIIVDEWKSDTEDESSLMEHQFDGQLYGQLISIMRQTCKVALKKHQLRLMAAMYKCTVQTSTQALGKVQTVLAQKHAKVISEDVNEMSGLFEIVSYMPVVESFLLCQHLRSRTSGLASVQLQFSHWQIIDDDPFWKPTTIDEMEEFGTNKGSVTNLARKYMDLVRKRKGISTDEVIVVNAEKQRNLKRNK